MNEELIRDNGLEVCPFCDELALHVYTAEQGEFLYCECCGMELVLDEIKH